MSLHSQDFFGFLPRIKLQMFGFNDQRRLVKLMQRRRAAQSPFQRVGNQGHHDIFTGRKTVLGRKTTSRCVQVDNKTVKYKMRNKESKDIQTRFAWTRISFAWHIRSAASPPKCSRCVQKVPRSTSSTRLVGLPLWGCLFPPCLSLQQNYSPKLAYYTPTGRTDRATGRAKRVATLANMVFTKTTVVRRWNKFTKIALQATTRRLGSGDLFEMHHTKNAPRERHTDAPARGQPDVCSCHTRFSLSHV